MRDRERERRGKMSVLFTYLCPYSMYCVYMYISCTPYQTIIKEEGREREGERERERERERENVYDRERERGEGR